MKNKLAAIQAKIKAVWGNLLRRWRKGPPALPTFAKEHNGNSQEVTTNHDLADFMEKTAGQDFGEATQLLDRTEILSNEEVDPTADLEAEIDAALDGQDGVNFGGSDEVPPVPGKAAPPPPSSSPSSSASSSSFEELPSDDLPPTDWKQKLQRQWRELVDKALLFMQRIGQALQKQWQQRGGSHVAISSWRDLAHLVQEMIYAPTSRPKVQQVFVLLGLVIITWNAGKVAAHFFTVAPKLGGSTTVAPAPRMAYESKINQIKDANLFQLGNQTTVARNPRKVNNLLCEAADQASSLGLNLVNTVTLQDSAKSVAAIKSGDEILNVREGQRVKDEAVIGRIERLRVYLRNLSTGECEYLQNDQQLAVDRSRINVLPVGQGTELLNRQQNAGIRNEGNKFAIKKNFRDKILNDISSVLSQARAVQIKNPDGTYFFKMTEIVPGSVYTQLNIQDGDIITSINGKKISDLNEVVSLLGRIKDIKQFKLGVMRNGQEQAFEYNFE